MIRVRNKDEKAFGAAATEAIDGGYRLRSPLRDGHAVVLLRGNGEAQLEDGSLRTRGNVAAALFERDADPARPREVFSLAEDIDGAE